MPTNVMLPYNGLSLDRAGARRSDREWVARTLADPAARVLAFWRDRCLVAEGVSVSVRGADAPVLLGVDGGVEGGVDGGVGVFATDLSDLSEPDALAAAGADAAADVRALFATVGQEEAATLAYARGMLHWRRNQRFCGACGTGVESRDAGHVLACPGCGKLWFPRIEPAVIMLVTAPDGRRCLLARHRGAAPGAYSTLAGFVEIGESLEDAVRRELMEEAGVVVDAVAYQASQAWPFPSGLMVGFRAEALSEEVAVDQDELVEARWFTREEVVAMIEEHRAAGRDRPDSIEAHLVATWLAE